MTKKKRKEIIKILDQKKFGTKNLPDAIKWHCSAYWDHALEIRQVKRSNKTKNLLATAIAIPISLKRSVEEYKILGKLILATTK